MILAAKYNKLRWVLIGTTDSLLVALNNELPGDFTVVARRKQRCPPDQGNHAPATVQQNNVLPTKSTAAMGQQRHQTPASESQQDVSSPPRSQLSQQPPSRPLPRPIPVVEIGAAARHAAQRSTNLRSPDHSDPAARRPAHPSPVTRQATTHRGDDTIVIGTSLINGLGSKLNSFGVNILTPGTNPKYIILQVGGNDATKRPAASIAARYESLVANNKRRCPQSTVIISKVPPRKGTMLTMSTINEINKVLDKLAERSQNVYSTDVCPTSIFHFKKTTHTSMPMVSHSVLIKSPHGCEIFKGHSKHLLYNRELCFEMQRRLCVCTRYMRCLESSLSDGTFYRKFSVIKSLGDGHYLIYSVVTGIAYMQPSRHRVPETACSVLEALRSEALSNACLYTHVYSSFESYENYMNAYVYHKQYDSLFGDIVPNIISNALK